jgi:hypothetical protein
VLLSHRWQGAEGERRAVSGDVIAQAVDDTTGAGGGNVIAWAMNNTTRDGVGQYRQA